MGDLLNVVCPGDHITIWPYFEDAFVGGIEYRDDGRLFWIDGVSWKESELLDGKDGYVCPQ